MPDLVYLDGFEHQVASANDLGATDGQGLYDTVVGPPTFVAGRTGGWAISCNTDSVSPMAFLKNHPGTDVDRAVHSYYIKTPATLPSIAVILLKGGWAAGTSVQIRFSALSNKFRVFFSTSDSADFGPTLSGGTWYRIDLKFDVSANPNVVLARVDGDAGTEASVDIAQAGTTIANTTFFDAAGSSGGGTWLVDDWVWSDTLADYPIGAHKVLAVVPESDDTGNSTYGTNVFEQGDGTDLSSSNQAWQYLDDWPPTNADAENDADHVTQSANSATYVRVNMGDTAESTIWGAVALAALKSDTTGANSANTAAFYSDATSLVLYGGDQSETAAHYRTVLLDAAKLDTLTEFNGLQIRIGNASLIPGAPEWLALMIQYAVPEGGGTETPQAVAVTMSLTLLMPRRPGKLVATTASVTSALARRLNRTLALTASHTVGAAKQLPKTIAASVTGSVDMARQKVKQFAVAVTSALAVGFTRNVRKPLATTLSLGVALAKRVGKVVATSSAVTASLTRRVAKRVAVTVTGTVANSTQKVKQLAIAVTTTVSAALSKLPRKLIAVFPTVAVTLIRRVGKPLATGIAHAVGVVADKISGGGTLFFQTIAVTVRFIRRKAV